MTEYFPFERKLIDEAMKLIPKEEVNRFSEVYDLKVENYLVVYSKYSKLFFGISAKRFLHNNYDSATIINKEDRLYYSISRLQRATHVGRNNYESNIQLFHFDDYLEEYGDNGYEKFEKECQSSVCNKINYAITYQSYPQIKELVDMGYCNFVNNIISYDNKNELFEININDYKLDKECKDYLNKNDRRPTWWLYLHKINLIDNITIQHIQFFNENNISPYDIYVLIKENSQYTVSSIIDYINRCAFYQGLNPSRVISNLLIYINSAKKINKKIDYYPSDLEKATSCVDKMQSNIATAFSKSRKHLYHYDYKKRIPYSYDGNYYYIRPENDIAYIEEMSQLFANYNITENIRENNDYYIMYDKKTNKEVAIIDAFNINKKFMRNKITKYNNNSLTHKEKVFIKEWLNHKKNVELYS